MSVVTVRGLDITLDPKFTSHDGAASPIALEDAIQSGLLDTNTRMFMDLNTRKCYTLKNAIDNRLINGDASLITDPVTGQKYTLNNALRIGIINGDTGALYNSKTGEQLSLMEAAENGMISNMYDPLSGRIFDSETGVAQSLDDAVVSGYLDDNKAIVFDPVAGQHITLPEAREKNIIDRQTGEYMDINTSKKMSASEALNNGLLVIVGAPILAGMAAIEGVKHVSKLIIDKSEIGFVSGKIKDTITVPDGAQPPQNDDIMQTSQKMFITKEVPQESKELLMTSTIFPVDMKGEDGLSVSAQKIKVKMESKHSTSLITESKSEVPIIKPVPRKSEHTPATIEYNRTNKPATGSQQTSIISQTEYFDTEIPQTHHMRLINGNDTTDQMFNGSKLNDNDTSISFDVSEYANQPFRFQRTIDSGLIKINGKTGIITDDQSGNVYSIEEALSHGIIDQHIVKSIDKGLRDSKTLTSSITLNEAVTRGLLILPLGRIYNPDTDHRMTIDEGIDMGFLDPDHSIIIDPATGKTLTLSNAIDFGMLNAHTGDVKNIASGNTLTLAEMSLEGLIPEHGLPAMNNISLHEAIEENMVNLEEQTFTDPRGTTMDIDLAIKLGYLDKDNNEYDSHEISENMTVDKAITPGLINENGMFCDSLTGDVIVIAGAVKRNLLKDGQAQNNDDAMTFKEAMEQGLIDIHANTFKDHMTGVLMPLDAAIRQGLVKFNTHDKLTSILPPESMQKFSTEKEMCEIDNNVIEIIKVQKTTEDIVPGMSIVDMLNLNLFNQETGEVYNRKRDEYITLREAMESHLVDAYSVDIKDKISKEIIDLETAMVRGLVDAKGNVIDHVTGVYISLNDALIAGLIQDSQTKIVRKIMVIITDKINVRVDTVEHPKTHQDISLEEAINSQCIDTESGLYGLPNSGTKMPLSEAHDQGLILGQILDVSTTREETKIKGGHSVHHGDDITSVFIAQTGQKLNKLEAVKIGLVDENSQCYKDPQTGEIFSIEEAVERGLIILQETVTETKKTLKTIIASDEHEPFEQKCPVKSVIDPRTADNISMNVAVTNGILKNEKEYRNPMTSGMVFSIKRVIDPNTKEELHPSEAVNRGIIDLQTGIYKYIQTGETIAIQEAFERKLISADEIGHETENLIPINTTATLGSKTFAILSVLDLKSKEQISVSEAIYRGCLDQSLRTYINLLTQEEMSIPEAIHFGYIRSSDDGGAEINTVVHQTKSYSIKSIIDSRTGEEIPIADAVRHQIVHKNKGQYLDLETNELISIADAIKRGLVIAEPIQSANEKSALIQLDSIPSTIVYRLVSVKDINTNIEYDPTEAERRGLINKMKGLYISPLTGKTISIKSAIDQGLVNATLFEQPDFSNFPANIDSYATIETTHESQKVNILHVLNDGIEISVVEGINRGIVDPLSGNYIDPTTQNIIPLHDALKMGLIKVDIQHKKSDMYDESPHLTNTFGITSFVDPRTGEALSLSEAITKGILDSEKGVYVDPYTGERIALQHAATLGFVKTSDAEAVLQSTEDMFPFTVDTKRTFIGQLDSGKLNEVNDKIVTINEDNLIKKERKHVCSYSKAVELGLINPVDGTYTDNNTGSTLHLQDAIDHGFVADPSLEGGNVTIIQAMDSNLYRKTCTDLVEDPKLPNSIQNDLNMGLIDRGTHVCTAPTRGNPMSRIGLFEDHHAPLSYENALCKGLIDPRTNTYTDPTTCRKMSLHEAIYKGLINDPMAPISYDDALNKGFIDPTSNAYTDRTTGRKIPLQEAIDTHLVEAPNSSLLYQDDLDSVLIDPRTNTYTDSRTDKTMSLHETLKQTSAENSEDYVQPMAFNDEIIKNTFNAGLRETRSELDDVCANGVVSNNDSGQSDGFGQISTSAMDTRGAAIWQERVSEFLIYLLP